MAFGLLRFDNATLYKQMNCDRAKVPSIANCIYDNVKLPCGSSLQLMRENLQHMRSNKHPGLLIDETVEEGVTQFYHQGKKIPYEMQNTTGGTINLRSKCRCSLCLYDPSWFYCHCSKCLPSHGFRGDPDPENCPYLVFFPWSDIYVYRNCTRIKKGWNHQLDYIHEKCCCIFHDCPENSKTPCLCSRCVLDLECECVTCAGLCNHCGEKSAVVKARNEIPCAHTKCENDKINLDWMPKNLRHPRYIIG